MPDTTRYPLVPAGEDQGETPLEGERVARWVPLAVPLLALLMVLVLVAIIGGVL